MADRGADLPWVAAQRMEAWAGELRGNVIRLAAITAFYGHHLFNALILKQSFPPGYTLAVSTIAIIWGVGCLALHVALVGRWLPPALPYAAVCFDALLATSLLLTSDGPGSPLVVVLFLIVASAPLRLNLGLVWATTLLAILSFAFVCGHAKWRRPEWRIPRRRQAVIVLGIAGAGFLAGQSVRQARRLARDYADRVRPEEPA
jgi:hypothetical protein